LSKSAENSFGAASRGVRSWWTLLKTAPTRSLFSCVSIAKSMDFASTGRVNCTVSIAQTYLWDELCSHFLRTIRAAGFASDAMDRISRYVNVSKG